MIPVAAIGDAVILAQILHSISLLTYALKDAPILVSKDYDMFESLSELIVFVRFRFGCFSTCSRARNISISSRFDT